ncbi:MULTISPECIES: hypothetical protein [unclassified Corynebacterium]|uniref:hypothetical protein n=1 Tax=unclassified Corynebacterium TaxID=2624378 RepID=UPI003524AE21
MVCTVDPEEENSDVVRFWTTLEEEARNKRLNELDALDPGLRSAIEKYDSSTDAPDIPSPTDLQRRIGAVGGAEGLGMLTTTTAEDAGVESSAADHKTEYTEQETRAAAAAIATDPAAQIRDALRSQAATGTRLDEIKAELFNDRAAEYNRTQEHLRNSLLDCADELKKATPLPTWIWIVGAITLTALLATVLTAIKNARRKNRHSRD